jgi:hypothetical protein
MPKEIPPFRLVPEALDEKARALPPFRWAADGVGRRHKLGGNSDFIERSLYPHCSCGKQMTFYGQLDSINDEFNIADCGIVSIFICFDCFETKSVLSSG